MNRLRMLAVVTTLGVLLAGTSGVLAQEMALRAAWTPCNPDPEDEGTLNQAVQTRMTWQAPSGKFHPQARFDVLMSKQGESLQLVAQDLPEPWYEPGKLEAGCDYQWQVICRVPGQTPILGPPWRVTNLQWVRAEIDATALHLRVLKSGAYAADLSLIMVASNGPVGLLFGPTVGDLAAEGQTIPTWLTIGRTLPEALSQVGWVRAPDLAGRAFPGLFPESETGTEIHLWTRVQVDGQTAGAGFQNSFSLTLVE